VIAAIALGAVFYTFSDLAGAPTYVLYAAGIIIGYFAGRMLLERTVRVFHKKALLGIGLLGLVLAGSMGLTYLDPIGIGKYVPELDQVKSAVICGSDKYYLYEDPYKYNRFEITDPKELADLQDFHRELYENMPDSGSTGMYDVCIRYTLKDGSQVKRTYQVVKDSEMGDRVAQYFSDARYVFQVEDPAILYDLFSSVNIRQQNWENGYVGETVTLTKDKEAVKGLLDAILADCADGKMAQVWLLHNGTEAKYYVEFEISDLMLTMHYDKYRLSSLRIWEGCTNTISYLEQIFAEKEDELIVGGYK
jgi:hypothetical protein